MFYLLFHFSPSFSRCTLFFKTQRISGYKKKMHLHWRRFQVFVLQHYISQCITQTSNTNVRFSCDKGHHVGSIGRNQNDTNHIPHGCGDSCWWSSGDTFGTLPKQAGEREVQRVTQGHLPLSSWATVSLVVRIIKIADEAHWLTSACGMSLCEEVFREKII